MTVVSALVVAAAEIVSAAAAALQKLMYVPGTGFSCVYGQSAAESESQHQQQKRKSLVKPLTACSSFIHS